MKDLWTFESMMILAGALLLSVLGRAQEPGCIEISRIASLAKANSSKALRLRIDKAGDNDNYRTRLVLAARLLEIDPQNRDAANYLLNLLPKDEFSPEQSAWLDLSGLQQCPPGGIPSSDLEALGRLQNHLPRLAAQAVILIPEKMPEYVAYAFLSINPESDYAVRMQDVCRVRNKQFLTALDGLSTENKGWFLTKIFNPQACRAIWLPEE
jgi:hypothetical protein